MICYLQNQERKPEMAKWLGSPGESKENVSRKKKYNKLTKMKGYLSTNIMTWDTVYSCNWDNWNFERNLEFYS